MVCVPSTLQKLAKEHGTPLFVVDHDELRKNYATFKKHLPRVQAYYAVKANSDPAIVKTLYEAGASFDVASMAEFQLVHENIKRPAGQASGKTSSGTRSSTPTRSRTSQTLDELDQYKPLVTYDNLGRDRQDQEARAARRAGAADSRCPTPGAVVELSSKFGASPGEAVDLIEAAFDAGLVGRRPQLPRRQPEHELRQLRAGAAAWRPAIFEEAQPAAIRR